MSEFRHLRAEREGDVLLVAPLFTYRALAEADLAEEWKALQAQLDDPGVQHVIIDLSAAPYFGSTMLEWFVVLWKKIKARQGKLAMCHVSDVGQEILAAARFDKLWPVYETRAEAVAGVRSGSE